jgi:hypothetical protein
MSEIYFEAIRQEATPENLDIKPQMSNFILPHTNVRHVRCR